MEEVNEISNRAKVVKDWEDFLNKYLYICNQDAYDKNSNPKGYINLGTAVNNLCHDIVLPRLTSKEVWECDISLLQYREGYGIPRLRKALAAVINKFLDPYEEVDPDDLICMVGVTACIDTLAHCIADPGDVILAPTPIYSRIHTDFMQRSQVRLWPIPIITKDNTESSPVLTIEKVKQAYHSAIIQNKIVRGVFLINPNNPLGDMYSPELLMDIFTFCEEHKLHVIVDEVYALSVYDGSTEFYSALKFPTLPNKNRTHVLYGISKDFGVAGLRIGAIHTRSKTLQNCLKQLSFFQNIPFPVMSIAAKFVEDLEWCKMYLSINKLRLTEGFRLYSDQLRKLGLNVRDSAGGFFIWADFGSVCGLKTFEKERDFFMYLIEEAHLYLVPGEELFCSQPGWFRLTFTAYPDNMDEALRRLEEAVKGYSSNLNNKSLLMDSLAEV